MSDSISGAVSVTLEDMLKTEVFQKMIRQDIEKFLTSAEWKDMLYDYMQEVLNEDLEILEFIEQEAKNLLLPRIRKALESI